MAEIGMDDHGVDDGAFAVAGGGKQMAGALVVNLLAAFDDLLSSGQVGLHER